MGKSLKANLQPVHYRTARNFGGQNFGEFGRLHTKRQNFNHQMKGLCVCLSALASIRQNINRQNLFLANSPNFVHQNFSLYGITLIFVLTDFWILITHWHEN